MAEEKSAEQVSEELAKQYEDEGKEVTEAVEANREEVEKYYEDQRKKEEARQQHYRDTGVLLPVGEDVPETPEDSGQEVSPAQRAVDTANAEPGEVPVDTSASPVDDSSGDKTAAEVVDEIKNANSADEVRSLSDGDDRKTVQKAAEKRLSELEEE